MTPRNAITSLLVAIGLGFGYSRLSAHGGGLDANGGHYNRKTGEYHLHRSASIPSNPPRSNVRQGLVGDGVGSLGSLTGLTSQQKVDALLAVLIRRGLITEAELVAELQRGR